MLTPKEFWLRPRLGAAVFVGLVGLLGWSTLADVMRESDQASLLRGALSLSREWSPSGQSFYNYDKQWLSYWIIAWSERMLPSGETGLEGFVGLGNAVAFWIAWLGVGAAIVVLGGRTWTSLCISSGALLSPVWLMSQPLLSSNVMSAGFLGLWIIAMEWGRERGGKAGVASALLAGLMAFSAVGCRVDAALVLPAWVFAWWGVGGG